MSPKAEPFVLRQKEHSKTKQWTAKKRRSRRRRRSAGNTKTSDNNVLNEASLMTKTPTVDVSRETKTMSLANLNKVSKAKTPKKQF